MYQSENNFHEDNYFVNEFYPEYEVDDYKNNMYDDNLSIFDEGFNTMMEKGNDDRFVFEEINIEEKNKKPKTEINPLSKTRPTDSETKKDEENPKHLGKKRGLENEVKKDENEEDKKSVEEEDNRKIKKGKYFYIYKEFNKGKPKGRKKGYNNIGEKGKHDKYSNDNIARKIKSKFFSCILNYINSSMIEVEIENPKKKSKTKKFKPFFLKPEQEIIKNVNIDFNLNLLNLQLKDIFSKDTSKKVEKNFGSDKNRKLVQKIYNEKNQERVIKILNMTLYQCLEHFRGTKFYEELSGLEKEYDNVIKELEKKEKEDEEEVEGEAKENYIEKFKDLLNEFKEYFENRNKRNKKTRNN